MSASESASWISTCDEYGELERRYVEAKIWLTRREDLRKKIESHYANEAPDDSFIAAGNTYQLVVGPRAMKRSIASMAKLFKRLGQKLFLEHCTFQITELDRLGIDTDGLVNSERTGTRTITAVPLEAPRAKPPAPTKKKSTAKREESIVEELPA